MLELAIAKLSQHAHQAVVELELEHLSEKLLMKNT